MDSRKSSALTTAAVSYVMSVCGLILGDSLRERFSSFTKGALVSATLLVIGLFGRVVGSGQRTWRVLEIADFDKVAKGESSGILRGRLAAGIFLGRNCAFRTSFESGELEFIGVSDSDVKPVEEGHPVVVYSLFAVANMSM